MAVRRATVGKEDSDLMERLGAQRPKVPHAHGGGKVGPRVLLLCVYKVAKLEWVAHKKDGSIVTNDVPVSFFGIKFKGEASWVSDRVGTSLLSADGREPREHGCLLTDFAQHVALGVTSDVLSDSKCTEGTSSFGMDDSLRNAFAIEGCTLLKKDSIHQGGSGGTCCQGVLVVPHRGSVV